MKEANEMKTITMRQIDYNPSEHAAKMAGVRFSERMDGERRTERVNMKILPSVKQMAEKKAKEEGRSLSNYIELLIVADNT